MFKKAFTLAEILVCLMVISIIAVVIICNINMQDIDDKSNMSQAYKVMNEFTQASVKIREAESVMCPTGQFMVNVAGTYDYTIVNSAGKNATSTEIVKLYKNYLKYENSVINFCDYTAYCSDNTIKGARLAGNVYIGFAVNNSIINCPSYRIPNHPDTITGTGKCWGKLYLDVNGSKKPNTLGSDVYVFGLNETGIVK